MSNPTAKFQAPLFLAGKTATGIVVPEEAVLELGKGKKPPVKISINGYTFRSTVAVMYGDYMIGVSAEHRQNAGVKAGDLLDVVLELDTEPRVVSVPADLQSAIDADSNAKEFFDKLSYSKKSGFVLSVEGAKTQETRKRRIDKSVEMLREGRA